MKLTILFPLATALLITLFFCLLPPLDKCRLPKRLPGRGRRESRGVTSAVVLVTLLYALTAFSRLGDIRAPQTSRVFREGESLTLELDGTFDLSRAMVRTMIGTGGFSFSLSEDGENWTEAAELEQNYVALLKWHEISLAGRGRYVRLTAWGQPELAELTLYDGAGAALPWLSRCELTDEQALTPARPTFLNSSYFDEIYHARTALEHMRAMSPYEISHPPLGKLLIALGMAFFGVTPFGWRFSGTLCGVLMLPLICAFARRLYGRGSVSVCCTVLLAADFMHFNQTRIATIDSYGVFFTLCMYYFMYRWLFPDGKDDPAAAPTEGRRLDLALSGVSFGLGAACKWTCLYAGAGLGVIWALHWLCRILREKQPSKRRKLLGALGKNILFCLVFFVLIPALIYYVSYYPYGAARGMRGPGMFFRREYLQTVLDNQGYMFRYHSGVNATHPYSSRWYQWMLDIRPILYYLDYQGSARSSFGAFNSPVLCWGGLAGLLVLLYCAVLRRENKALFLLLGYFAQLVPWMFITRITFAYHYFPCSVFLVLVLGYVFALMRDNLARWRAPVWGFTALAAALFALFYPVLWGAALDNRTATLLYRWLSTWPF